MSSENINIINEIKSFLDGHNDDLKYIVNVEADPSKYYAECIIHEPNCEKEIRNVPYIPFMYMKDLEAKGIKLYSSHGIYNIYDEKVKAYGITITKLKTGNQKRLKDGYCYLIESSKSYNDILEFLKDGGCDPYEKVRDEDGYFVKDFQGRTILKNKDLFMTIKPVEQFFISTKSRLYKGFDDYKDIHRLTYDIETNGLRFNIARVFAIGVKDNRGLKKLLKADKLEDDESERKLITEFFNLLVEVKPAVVVGQNSETFDIDFILGRAKLLKLNIYDIQTTLKKGVGLTRKPNMSVKYGNRSDKYVATNAWGMSFIDTLHAIKRTAANNSEIKRNDLKYIAKFEKIATENRTYIKGEGNDIYYFYKRNNFFICDEKNNYKEIPAEFQSVGKSMLIAQYLKADGKMNQDEYNIVKNKYFRENPKFVDWLRAEAVPNNMFKFINGKKLTEQYLLDDLWETEQVDELYNQSSFMLAKIVPTNYQRICTMGTASVWNLLMTTWSYENGIAIPFSEKKEAFSGGLARTFKTGFGKRWVKIDYASLYPMIQLTYDVFPMFDITGVIKKMLMYLTTTRNIYKKLANGDELNENELTLVMTIDHDTYIKYINGTITAADKAKFKIKQLPIKILNNSLFGALGSGIAFNWSDNICAARITCTGRLFLRFAVSWFSDYGCIPLLAVTDGINFQIPEKTKFRVTDDGVVEEEFEDDIEVMWNYGGKSGIAGLINKYNAEMKADGESKLGSQSFMAVDNDGEFISCLNLSRINYATLSESKDKKTGEVKEKVKLTGNTIKSKTMPEYIEDFIDKGLDLILHEKGYEFVEYYNSYVDDIYYMQIPLKKIASKMRYKQNLKSYDSRGNNKNGKPKSVQAHMELIKDKRKQIGLELFEKHKDGIITNKSIDKLSDDEKIKLVSDYMPPEPEIDSMIYFVNTGTKMSEGNSSKDVNGNFNSTMITNDELLNNSNLKGKYNVAKYLGGFNKKVKSLLAGFEPDIAKKILATIKNETVIIDGKKTKRPVFKKYTPVPSELGLKLFDFNSVEDSMILEPKEVDFWNKTGYDPYLIWNGFKCSDDYKLRTNEYTDILNLLNEKMASVGKSLIKSINEKYVAGDFVLIKNEYEYMLGEYDGVYIKIIKTIDNLPKSEYQIEMENKKLAAKQKAMLNNENYVEETIDDKKIKYFDKFRKKYDIGSDITVGQICSLPNGEEAMLDFIEEMEENEIEDELSDELNDDHENDDMD